MREDEGVKLILSSAELLKSNAQMRTAMAEPTEKKTAAAASACLYLRVSALDSPVTKEALAILRFSKGDVPVLLYESTSGKKVSPKNVKIAPSDRLLGALRALLGEENVVFRQGT